MGDCQLEDLLNMLEEDDDAWSDRRCSFLRADGSDEPAAAAPGSAALRRLCGSLAEDS